MVNIEDADSLDSSSSSISKELDSLIKEINSRFGEGAAVLSDTVSKVDVIDTGILELNKCLGVGGWPQGRVIEIYGNPSSGKTTLSIHAMSEAQRAGHKVAFIDVEHAFDRSWAESLGVNVDEMVFVQPSNAEEALEIANMLVKSGQFGLIILDSVAALVTKAELSGDMGDAHVGLLARLMSQALRKLTAEVKAKNVCFMFINQVRDNIAVSGYGPKTVTTGGKALPFYASVRAVVTRVGGVKGKADESDIGNKVQIKIAKNKLAAPFKVASAELLFDSGFCKINESVRFASDIGLIKKAGAWYTYKNEKYQGANAVREFFKSNPDEFEELYNTVSSHQ